MSARYPSRPEALPQGFVDLREYLLALKRRRWLIAAIALGFLALAAAYSFTATPVYTATAKVLVKPTGVDPAAAANAGPSKLVNLPTEAEVAASSEVASIAAKALRSTSSPQTLLQQESVAIPTNALLLLEISYSDPRPGQAQKGAIAFAQAYLQYQQSQATLDLTQRQAQFNAVIAQKQATLVQVNRIIAAGPANSTKVQIALTQKQQLQRSIDQLQANLDNLAGINTDPGHIVTTPTIPQRPSSPNHKLQLGLGLFLGLLAGIGVALVKGRTDDRLRERDQLAETMDAPVLAVIPKVADWHDPSKAKLVTLEEPRSPCAEAYRTLRPTLLAAAAQQGVKTIMVVSPTAGEGKTTTAANLAVVLAQADRSVALVSADLRKPRIHEFFGLDNERGLSDVLAGTHQPWETLRKSGVDNLWILPSGAVPPRPAELLQSRTMRELLQEQREVVDFILLDCPPVLVVGDSLELVPLVDAVLLVADAGFTTRDAVGRARDQLLQMGATILGSVLNDLDPRSSAYYYGYGYGKDGSGPSGTASAGDGGAKGSARRRDRQPI